ncbi:MAG: ABC transporter substrate-binding protein, partial [Actinomycetota bacterium]
MRSTTRRAVSIAAAGLIAVAGAGVLTACGSSGGGSESSSAAPAPTDEGAQVIGPVIVEPGQTSAEVAV